MNKIKNPCIFCRHQVKPKCGIQCQGACKKWAHFDCLQYSPEKIKDIKNGCVQVTCPCPGCATNREREKCKVEVETCPGNLLKDGKENLTFPCPPAPKKCPLETKTSPLYTRLKRIGPGSLECPAERRPSPKSCSGPGSRVTPPNATCSPRAQSPRAPRSPIAPSPKSPYSPKAKMSPKSCSPNAKIKPADSIACSELCPTQVQCDMSQHSTLSSPELCKNVGTGKVPAYPPRQSASWSCVQINNQNLKSTLDKLLGTVKELAVQVTDLMCEIKDMEREKAK